MASETESLSTSVVSNSSIGLTETPTNEITNLKQQLHPTISKTQLKKQVKYEKYQIYKQEQKELKKLLPKKDKKKNKKTKIPFNQTKTTHKLGTGVLELNTHPP